MSEELFTIDQLAQASGTSTRTIRFYAQEKLLPPPKEFKRRLALYGPEHLEKLKVIKMLKEKYLPLDVIRKAVTEPHHVDTVLKKLQIGGEILELLGYRPPTLTAKQLSKRGRVAPEEIAELTELGFLCPMPTPNGPRYTLDDLRIVNLLEKFKALGLSPKELDFMPRALEQLAVLWFDRVHDKVHDAFEKGPETALNIIETCIKTNKELTALILEQSMRKARTNHFENKHRARGGQADA